MLFARIWSSKMGWWFGFTGLSWTFLFGGEVMFNSSCSGFKWWPKGLSHQAGGSLNDSSKSFFAEKPLQRHVSKDVKWCACVCVCVCAFPKFTKWRQAVSFSNVAWHLNVQRNSLCHYDSTSGGLKLNAYTRVSKAERDLMDYVVVSRFWYICFVDHFKLSFCCSG